MVSGTYSERLIRFVTVSKHWFFLIFATLLFSAHADEQLTVVSWGGSYAKACKDGYIDPFATESGVKVHLADYNGGLAQVRAQVESGNVHWDVIDVETQDLILGCDEGLFEPLTDLHLPQGLDGSDPSNDFLPGAITECGVATLVGAGVIAYNSEGFKSEPPSTIDDFFDLDKYPGKRGMRRTPIVNLEWALIATGVEVTDVYDVLSTIEGLNSAFDKLDTIKDLIVFWEAGAQPPQLLADQEVVMTSAYNGRIFNAQVVEEQPFVIIWDGHARDYGHWAIISGSTNISVAEKFIQYAARSESLAAVSNRISYAPSRKSSWELVGQHVEMDVNMQEHMPTHPENSKRYFTINSEWWAEHKDDLTERFSAWVLQ
ncbi:MAG: ABC transporter substrate-binding protein [Gammaproteobacteria bacterium]|nr:ABC transporter substrate-binding protein [Gammaproteobacteria bacterium]MDE0252450.1 ABC transporter substrate-binding protein [Gammaproteobacteria bacterium]MDE0402441.1 ABC transporter substrate-binding protein [Gammaproteobacteria bacterium]